MNYILTIILAFLLQGILFAQDEKAIKKGDDYFNCVLEHKMTSYSQLIERG